MTTQLEKRVERLRLRKSDPENSSISFIKESLAKSTGKFDKSQDAMDYISESMAEVDINYTKKTFEESDRVQKQIAEACSTNNVNVSFQNQGSVTNNTHIRFFSDIDLLVLTEHFITIIAPLKVTNPYKGDPIQELLALRKLIETRLTNSYYEASVDTSGSKAIRISGGSLRREIDVIPANWCHTKQFEDGDKNHRGVMVLDTSGPTRVRNFPFLHNKEIDSKDIATFGALRKIIRFVKSVKYDSDIKINVSSYDIASLCYHIDPTVLTNQSSDDLLIACAWLQFTNKLLSDSNFRSGLQVPNRTRLLFSHEGINVNELEVLSKEVESIVIQAKNTRIIF